MAFSRSVSAVLVPVFLFGSGAMSVAAWDGGFLASFALALLMAAWLAALMVWRRPPVTGGLVENDAQSEDKAMHVLLRAVLEKMPVALVSIGGDNRVRALNRAARELFAASDLIPEPPPELSAGVQRMTLFGRTYRIDRVEGTKSASMRTIAAIIDVENEERMAEARATREVLDILSHEVMNAITPISSLAESALLMLDEEPVPAAALRDAIGTLGRRSGGLLQFTAAYRELARLPEPAVGDVSLDQLVVDLSRMFAARWGERVRLSCSIEETVTVAADRDQLEQALWALLQNAAEAAIEHSSEPRIGLTVTGRGPVVIEIADNGGGIDPAVRDRIFRPFVTTKAAGSGIGLSLAQQIVQAHGGRLLLVPRDEAGAVFQIHLSSLAGHPA